MVTYLLNSSELGVFVRECHQAYLNPYYRFGIRCLERGLLYGSGRLHFACQGKSRAYHRAHISYLVDSIIPWHLRDLNHIWILFFGFDHKFYSVGVTHLDGLRPARNFRLVGFFYTVGISFAW